ncbi:hypothetical protein TNCV_3610011 [Trichonephila clavipes]|nr:hypothetical protein TNCV_3610011 [Trichonephila clavipes]
MEEGEKIFNKKLSIAKYFGGSLDEIQGICMAYMQMVGIRSKISEDVSLEIPLRNAAENEFPISFANCQVIYAQFGLAIHQNAHQARRRFVEWAQNEIAVVPDFHKRILFSDEAHFCLNGNTNKQNYRIWSEANPQVYVEIPLHPEKLTV